MILSGHVHPGEIRAPKSSRYPNLNIKIMMTPSVTPDGFMNPGYTILDLNESNPKRQLHGDSFKYKTISCIISRILIL